MIDAFPGLGAVRTLPELLTQRERATPQGEAYREWDAAAGDWQRLDWAQTLARVQQFSRAIAGLGLPPGARIAILLPNGIDAMSVDQATLATGCVPVPLHAIDNPGSIAYILADAEVSLLVVAELAQWEHIRGVGAALPQLRAVVVTQPGAAGLPAVRPAAPTAPALLALADWLAQADPQAPLPPGPAPGDLAAIVYTSGTTGKPKGVMLTHANVVADVAAVLARITPVPQDVFLSFLPLSHTFERTAGYYLPMAAGSSVVYARSVALLAQDLRSVRPTVLVSVPRIYERVHAKVLESLSTSPLKRRLFDAAQDKGWRRFRARQGLAPEPMVDAAARGGWARLLPWPLLRALVAVPLLEQFGGRVRVAVSGGAPLSPAIARCFLGLGLGLVQGYGMTETTPVVSVNTLDDNDPATVGRPLPGVQVRIGANRELQVAGPIVMKGYWKRPEDTARVLDGHGWLSTGDQAEIVDGRIRILGRLKEIIVTSTGEKVPPGDLELAITADPLFAQAFVVGEDRPFIAAVVVLNGQEWTRLAGELSLDPAAAQSLADPRAQRAALERIERQAASFPRYAVPRAIHLSLEPWTVENTFMTPTLKLKRNNLMAQFAPAIEAMYTRR
ncbi:AMP-dependent synthetase/ligase [Melaminivora jejuensis]|uniref:AMP-dependent synthetase/ligase n=1 Tax=Melaminivora jejuensis TaxID=1267217 RepID=UPI001E3A9A33|nr:AMP-binding protein [Melaminivora jejuensis]UHJ63550.1 AMP-binding protein [Melaminivora jejuensis]